MDVNIIFPIIRIVGETNLVNFLAIASQLATIIAGIIATVAFFIAKKDGYFKKKERYIRKIEREIECYEYSIQSIKEKYIEYKGKTKYDNAIIYNKNIKYCMERITNWAIKELTYIKFDFIRKEDYNKCDAIIKYVKAEYSIFVDVLDEYVVESNSITGTFTEKIRNIDNNNPSCLSKLEELNKEEQEELKKIDNKYNIKFNNLFLNHINKR